jgi:hypothetical protein
MTWTPEKELDILKILNFAFAIIEKTKNEPKISNLMPTEPRPWDGHFLIAAQIVLLQNELTPEFIMKAISILEVGLKNTGKNSDIMLLALNLYAKMECVTKALEYTKNLDIKSIQFDSLGYLSFPLMARLEPGRSQI